MKFKLDYFLNNYKSMYVSVNTALINNYEVLPIRVELDCQNGLPGVKIIGLADTAVRESYFRVSTALKACGYKIPAKKILINFMPANIPKKGSSFDFALAVALLKVMEVIELNTLNDYTFLGEISLKGELKKVNGVLSIIEYLNKKSSKKLIVPSDNIQEASLLNKEAVGLSHIKDFIKFIKQGVYTNTTVSTIFEKNQYKDFLDVINQPFALRGVEIAVTGKHHFLMIGTPGSGKSMIGERIPYVMPDLNEQEIIEINSLYSMSGLLSESLIKEPPFRSPHHTTSDSALIGGRSIGEITLAHNGVLFLDELSEFRYNVLNALREPLEKAYINISRVGINVKLPAKFLLVSASNPCNCGNYLRNNGTCTCTVSELIRFRRKLNGPLMDRFDIKIPIDIPNIIDVKKNERYSSSNIKKNVLTAIEFSKTIGKQLIDKKALDKIKSYAEKYKLTARGVNKTIGVAKTIALLDSSKDIQEKHMTESMLYTKPIKWVEQG